MTEPRRRDDLRSHKWRKLRLAVLDRDGWRCAQCGVPLEGDNATVDHIDPFVSVEESNHPGNLISLCRPCNSAKGNRVLARVTYVNRRWLPNGVR